MIVSSSSSSNELLSLSGEFAMSSIGVCITACNSGSITSSILSLSTSSGPSMESISI